MNDPQVRPQLSVVLLTRNEEANVVDALRSLTSQEGAALEVIVVDSASTDRTVALAEAEAAASGGRVRVIASERDLTIGEARNLGVREARAPVVAFMSADATAAPGWAAALLGALAHADVAYGRQEHAPPELTVAAVVRGMRYHHFDLADRLPPETYASNVNAGIRRDVFERLRYVDEGPASALDDVLFTREALGLGHRVAYEPRMLVRHKDATTLRGELVKNRREGYGWGLLAPRLGLNRMALAWGAGLGATLVLLGALPGWPTALLALAALYAPTVRRALAAGRRYARRAPHLLLGAVLVGPALDLAFLVSYVRGLRDRRADLTGVRHPQGA